MKITPITVYKPIKQSFKHNEKTQIYYDDYDTYNPDITLKDAFISAGITTGLCFLATTLIANEDKIKSLMKKVIVWVKKA
ncbi:MAG: hypothetical protein IJY61_05685 [Candidatus Gastranaerophilales bacterium]|nr:hypothetical protein [Candidatus Gastranaerophilales bacterium]